MTASAPAPVAVPELPSPHERNWTWRVLQFFMQNLFTFWIRFRAKGFENLPPGGALLLINHQSFIDPLLVGVALTRPVSFLARDNLFRVPIIGWILKNTYVMPIRRESAGTESIRESVRRLQRGFYVGVFPEGTRTNDGELGPLKPGFQLICKRAGVPIVPVGIAGAFAALPRGSWWLRPVPVRVVYGEPLSVEQVAYLCERGREAELLETVRSGMDAAHKAALGWLEADTGAGKR